MDKPLQKSISSQETKEPNRAYGCPCGKTYLSYPALFTHVKQKHDGKPPGKLTKPKTGKIRGRPKTRIDPLDPELMSIINTIQHDITQLVGDQFIDYDAPFQKSDGNTTCQDIASAFLEHFENLGENAVAILICFLNELKQVVDQKYGEEHWSKEKPTDIIQVANQLFSGHQDRMSTFPISQQIFKELIFNYFQWLYANKFTNHRLLKKSPSEQGTLPTQ